MQSRMGCIYSTMSQLQRKASARKTALSFKLLTEKTGRGFAFPERMRTANVQVPRQREQKLRKGGGLALAAPTGGAGLLSFHLKYIFIDSHAGPCEGGKLADASRRNNLGEIPWWPW